MTNEPMPNKQTGLKYLVIFMGVLIIIGLGVVVGTVIKRMMKTDDNTVETTENMAPTPIIKSQISSIEKFNINFKLEAGKEILGADLNANGILLRIGQDGKTEKLILVGFDGRLVGTLGINN